MPPRLALVIALATLIAVVVGVPTAVAYGGVRWWGPWLGIGGAVVCLALVWAVGRRPERPRLATYTVLAVAVGCALLGAWLWVQRGG